MAYINSLTGVLKYIGAPDGSSDSNRNLDAWYGPYENISEALQLTLAETSPITGAVTTFRYIGMTVGIYNATGGVDEYWFKDGIEDNDLIPKIPDIDAILGNIKVAKFDKNGGSGHMNSLLSDDEVYVKMPVCTFTHTSGSFQGWSTISGGDL